MFLMGMSNSEKCYKSLTLTVQHNPVHFYCEVMQELPLCSLDVLLGNFGQFTISEMY